MKVSRTHQLIYDVVQRIPKGKVATYGEIAELAGLFGQARLVGYALHNLPRNTDVPWQRVINAQGKISLPDIDGMYERQKSLLKKEGIVFMKERVDFAKYGWIRRTNKQELDHLKRMHRWQKTKYR